MATCKGGLKWHQSELSEKRFFWFWNFDNSALPGDAAGWFNGVSKTIAIHLKPWIVKNDLEQTRPPDEAATKTNAENAANATNVTLGHDIEQNSKHSFQGSEISVVKSTPYAGISGDVFYALHELEY